jgi:hypothetical protein
MSTFAWKNGVVGRCVALAILICFLATLLPPVTARADLASASAPVAGGVSATLGSPPSSGETPQALASVNLATGAAQTDFPFQTQKARGDAQPLVRLSYDSSRGVGFAGIGWTLDGSQIVRKGASGMPLFADSALTSPSSIPQVADDYYLDGQLLVPVCKIAGAACAGAPTAVPATLAGTSLNGFVLFMREVDDAAARYFFNGQTWLVQTKTGHVLQYGRALDTVFPGGDGVELADSATLGSNGISTQNPPIYRWTLVRDSDVAGNTVYYVWGQAPNGVPQNGVSYLTDVYDTADNTAAPTVFAHHVHLTWAQRLPGRTPFGFTNGPVSK